MPVLMKQLEKFIARHPVLFHMADAGSWDSIRRYGLLSVSALLDLYEIKGTQHSELFSMWRPCSILIRHPIYGNAVIRDQHPMPPDRLMRELEKGISPSAWYETLNKKCFFWVDEIRLLKMLNTSLYKDNEHDVLTLDTRSLIERDSPRIRVSHINTGYAGRSATKRSAATFHTIQECSRVGRKDGIAELTVEPRVDNIEEVTLSVVRRKGSEVLETIWKR